MKKLFFILLIFLIAGCAVSNKRHNLKIHPHGYWTGKGWHPNNDSTKICHPELVEGQPSTFNHQP